VPGRGGQAEEVAAQQRAEADTLRAECKRLKAAVIEADLRGTSGRANRAQRKLATWSDRRRSRSSACGPDPTVEELKEQLQAATEAAEAADKRFQARKDELAAARENAKALQAEVDALMTERRGLETELVNKQVELRRLQLDQSRNETEVRAVPQLPSYRWPSSPPPLSLIPPRQALAVGALES